MQQDRPGCLVPAYWDVNSTRWDTLITAKQTYKNVPIAVIINIDGGAGSSTNSSWNLLINRLRSNNIIVLGYVNTNSAQDDVNTVVIPTINAWDSYYPQIDGIFFDNLAIQDTTANKTYYQTAAIHAKTKFDVTVGNCKVAANVVEDKWSGGQVSIDTFVVWDGGRLDAVDTSYSKYQHLPNYEVAVMAWGIPALDTSWIGQMAQYMGWIYTTTGTGSVPYNSLPSYFNNLISQLDKLGAGVTPTPPPPTAGTGGSTGTGTGAGNVSVKDKFGVRKIYWTKEGGEEWFMNMQDLLSDSRVQNFEGENIKKMSDGSYQSNGGSNGQLRVEAWSPAYSNQTQRKNARWLNVETTIYAKHISGSSSYVFQLYCKGGHHTSARHCEGCAYKFRWAQDGTCKFAKEVCHSAYSGNVASKSSGTKWNNGRWHGLKAVQYNVQEGNNTYVKLELWGDPDCSDSNGNLVIRNNWRLYTTYVDRGGWAAGSSAFNRDCGGCGRSRDEILTGTYSVTNSSSKNYNRNLVAYRTDGRTTRFMFFSAREIDPDRPTASTTPPTTEPPVEEEPEPPIPPAEEEPPEEEEPIPPIEEPPPPTPPPEEPPSYDLLTQTEVEQFVSQYGYRVTSYNNKTDGEVAFKLQISGSDYTILTQDVVTAWLVTKSYALTEFSSQAGLIIDIVGRPSDTPTTPPPPPPPPPIEPEPEPEPEPPPPGDGTVTLDPWSGKKIYSTKSGGYEWYMDMAGTTTPATDGKLSIYNLTVSKNSDGSYKGKSSSGSDVALFMVPQRNGYNPVTTAQAAKNHSYLHDRGYMQDASDWRNVEMTMIVKANQLLSSPETAVFQLYARGGRHLNPTPNCEGSALRAYVYSNGQTSCRKEQWHSSFAPHINGPGIGSIVGKWVGIKFVIITREVYGGYATKQEIWLDKNLDGTWEKWDERTDQGNWGDQGDTCKGAPDQLITWGGPLAFFGWSGFRDVDFKWFAIREISSSGVPIYIPPPTAGDTPTDFPYDPGSGGGTGEGTWENPYEGQEEEPNVCG